MVILPSLLLTARQVIRFGLSVCLLYSACVSAQTGRVDYPYLGIQFTIPKGWRGQESGEVFVMGSVVKPGLLLMTLSEARSPQYLKSQADAGIVDDEGTFLMRHGYFDKVGIPVSGRGSGVSLTVRRQRHTSSVWSALLVMVSRLGPSPVTSNMTTP